MNGTNNRLFIHATNVHQGGGRALLSALLAELANWHGAIALLDTRMPVSDAMARGIEIMRIVPSILARLNAERWLVAHVAKEDTVLCFGNLPPLFRLRGRTAVFVQNRYLIDGISLRGFPLRVRLRLMLERMWLSGRLANADEFIVQTQTMKRLIEKKLQGKIPVRVLSFVAEPKGYGRSAPASKSQKNEEYDFIYVASGEPHKNHRRLLEAWCQLAQEGLFPSLCMTLDETRFEDLCSEVEAQRRLFGLKIKNIGELSHKQTLALYIRAGAMIYPSTFESFGLPLIEARQAGLAVLAPELDYVRDVIDPEQVFDPRSPHSIARAVKRFMAISEPPLPLLNAKGFLDGIVGEVG